MSTQADLSVGFVVVRTEQEYPDALEGDSLARWVPKLNVLAVFRNTRRIGVQLVDQEVSVPPGWKVGW